MERPFFFGLFTDSILKTRDYLNIVTSGCTSWCFHFEDENCDIDSSGSHSGGGGTRSEVVEPSLIAPSC